MIPSRPVARILPFWALCLVALLAAAAVWGPGLVNTRGGGDSPFLLQRTHQIAVNLRAGVFPVRWMPDAAYGLGYPFFNHYSALPFYLAALFNLLGLDLLTALKLTQTLGFLVAALAMFGWVNRLWRNRIAAGLAAIAYTVSPFHLVNVYVRGDSLSEFYAFAFYPLILGALERLVERHQETQKIRCFDIAWLALAYAGLVLSHNISAFIFSPFALLYLLLLAWEAEGREHRPTARGADRLPRRHAWLLRTLVLGLVGLILGMALAAWAWLPALLEIDYVQAENLTGGFFDYTKHFRGFNLVQLRPLFDYSIKVAAGGPSPFAVGSVQMLVAVVGLLVLLVFALRKRRVTRDESLRRENDGELETVVHRLSIAFLVIGLALSSLMITPLSRPLWDYLPLLEMVQFPWRFLSVQSLFTSVVSAALVLRLKGGRAWGTAGAIAAALTVSTLLPLRPDRLPIGPDDVSITRLQEYEVFSGNIGTSVRYEWLPRAAVPRPFTFDTVIAPESPPTPIPLTGTLVEAKQTQHRPTERDWRVQTGEEGATLAFPLLYWPGWGAQVDGAGTAVWAVDGAGYLALDVPPGEHNVRLGLGRTSLRAAAETLSLVALLILATLAIWRTRRSELRAAIDVLRNTVYAIPVLVGLLILVTGSSTPPSHLDDLTMDFVDMPYLHHNPDGAAFADPAGSTDDDEIRLLNYTVSEDRPGPGETLSVTLRWDTEPRTGDGERVTLRLVSPAEHLPNGISSYALTEDSQPLDTTTVHRLVVPENTPRGLYLLQLSIWGRDDKLSGRYPANEQRRSVYLQPVRVTEGAPLSPDAPLLALVGPNIRLHAAELQQAAAAAGPSDLTVRLEWSTVRRMASNYNVSVRLLDPNGDTKDAIDTQPGYGFAPTSLWRPGERVADRYNLLLSGDLTPGKGYRLRFIFYYASSGTEVARVELGPFPLPLESPFIFEPSPRLYEVPPVSYPLAIDFTDPTDGSSGDHIRLAGYDLKVETESLDVTLWWVAQRQPYINYTVFVHLFDPTNRATVITQNDAMPRQGSYPTSGWLAGEVVSDTIRLSLQELSPGTYQLAVGLYDVATGDRLVATAPDGVPVPDGRLILPNEIEVPED